VGAGRDGHRGGDGRELGATYPPTVTLAEALERAHALGEPDVVLGGAHPETGLEAPAK
jgi:hypothetical protein